VVHLKYFGVKKIILILSLFVLSNAFAQQHFFYGLQLDYGPFMRSIDQNGSVLKGKGMGRMLNLRLSASYRLFDALTFETGMSLNGMKWKLEDKNFKSRNTGFEALMLTQNRFMSFYGNFKYSYDMGRKRYLFLRTGLEYSSIGSDSITQQKKFDKGNEIARITQIYGRSNWAITPEIGYEYFNSSGNLITIGLKYHHKFAGDDFIKGDYFLSNSGNLNVKDQFTISGSYLALTVQFNGLLTYKAKKERIIKEKIKEPKDTIKKEPDLVVTPVDTTKPVLIDNKQANDRDYAVTNKIKVTNNKVKIYVWDHQIEDGDRINLILNDEWILTDYTLKNNKRVIEVTLQPGTNNLILYALNLGKYKPNTAAIVVDDGTKQQQVILESTLDESSALEIKFDAK
jgi:hypothetical protein